MAALTGRLALVLLVLVAWPAAESLAQSLSVEAAGDLLKIRAKGFNFLTGDPLEDLKDGRSVRLELSAMVLPGPDKPVAAATRRIFAVSYDLWEERFAVTTVERRSQSITHLTQAAAEAWCIDQLAIPLNALGKLGPDQPFWLRLEFRIVDAESTSASDDSGFTLQALIDWLSRRRNPAPAAQAIERGPFRLRPGGASSTR